MTQVPNIYVKNLVFTVRAGGSLTPVTTSCFCCRSKDKSLVRLSTCKHKTFLENYFRGNLSIYNKFICTSCHIILKKINWFVNQIILSSTNSEKILKRSILTCKKTSTEYILLKHDYKETELGPFEQEDSLDGIVDPDDANQKQNYTDNDKITEVVKTLKSEIVPVEHTNNVVFVPDDVKPEATQLKNDDDTTITYTRLQEIHLSHSDLIAEREKAAKDETYLSRSFKCEKCIVSFVHAKNLTRHKTVYHNEKNPFICDICSTTFNSQTKLDTHRKNHYFRYKCLDCNKCWNSKSYAKTHWLDKHEKNHDVYKCDDSDCEYETGSRVSYQNHKRTHNKVECPVCLKIFSKGWPLETHINQVHNKSTLFKCKDCEKSYKCRYNLKSHVAKAHGPQLDIEPSQSHYCAPCGRDFKTQYILARHLKTHPAHVAKKYECDVCSKKFSIKSYLKEHIMTKHMDLKTKHKCPQCDKELVTLVLMKRHIKRVHEKKEKPRDKICEHCGRGFSTNLILKHHLRTHTGERPYVCKTCGTAFKQNSTLNTHIKLVHGVKRKQETK